MAMIGNEKVAKSSNFFFCKKCDYTTNKKYNYEKHVLTAKHLLAMFGNEKVAKSSKSSNSHHVCSNCYKQYTDYSGLWKHKKKCTPNLLKVDTDTKPLFDKEFIMSIVNQNQEVIKQNCELQQSIIDQQNQMLEVIKNGTHNTNSHNVNSHNKTFNLQFFLNETCKDAMNIADFVDSIKVSLMDLEKIGEIGYVEGISNIITNNLKALDVTQRPIHCTDNKRDVLYIKDENKWEKETDEKKKVRKVIKSVVNKNIKMIPTFQEVHPECVQCDSIYSEQYNKIIIESLGGSGENDWEKEDKIIKKITKDILIDK